jgi:hypothetical protein
LPLFTGTQSEHNPLKSPSQPPQFSLFSPTNFHLNSSRFPPQSPHFSPLAGKKIVANSRHLHGPLRGSLQGSLCGIAWEVYCLLPGEFASGAVSKANGNLYVITGDGCDF